MFRGDRDVPAGSCSSPQTIRPYRDPLTADRTGGYWLTRLVRYACRGVRSSACLRRAVVEAERGLDLDDRAASASESSPFYTANTTWICSSTDTCRDGFCCLLTLPSFAPPQLNPLPED